MIPFVKTVVNIIGMRLFGGVNKWPSVPVLTAQKT